MNKVYWSICKRNTVIILTGLIAVVSQADSLWRSEQARPMFADKRASTVGDILTIVVQESSTASKDASTKTSRKSATDASVSSFFYPTTGALTHKGKLPALKFESASDFNGTGQVGSTETITSRIAVRVVDVLPNGNLIIEGTRHTAFSGETQDVILRGLVRTADIGANNTVYSYNIADVSIQIVSKGAATTAQKKGWFNRVWDKVSPF
jgi:flagellar L-ring protein precursor FlgH